MAYRFAEPDNVPGAVSSGYQTQNNNFNAVRTGHINLMLTGMDGPEEPLVMRGSVLEVNGGLFRTDVSADEAVVKPPGTPAADAENFIWAVPQENGSLVYQYLTGNPAPEWSAAKGGWYSGNRRAIAKLFYTGGQFSGKVILDSYEAAGRVNTRRPVPAEGGVLVFENDIFTFPEILGGAQVPVAGDYAVPLPPGAYRYELKGGNSGAGGSGGTGGFGGGGGGGGSGSAGGAGAAGNPGEGGFPGREKAGGFYHSGGTLHITLGQNGGGGGTGGTGGRGGTGAFTASGQGGSGGQGANGGGGGGGGAGTASAIAGVIIAEGGRSGAGGAGAGAGGSGGYGTGGHGGTGGQGGGSPGYPGTRGQPPPEYLGIKLSSGYARIYRLW
jgi:hypothetical protein